MALKYKKNSLCIIIPMHNEEKIASLCIDKVIKEIKTIKNFIKLLIVNDGSSDNTLEILNKKRKKYSKYLIILSNKKNKGYGKSLATGIYYALKNRFEYYLTMDSDLTNPPKYIHNFIKVMSNNIDCVKASRYIKEGKVVNVSFFRQIISIVGNYIASLFFNVGIKDCTNGFKMVRLELLKGIKFKENSFSIILEEMYYLKKRQARFIEIPNILYARTATKSHFRYKIATFYDYFKYVIKAAVV